MPAPEMTLVEKGPFQKPPVLKGAPQSVSSELQRWPGMVSATHWTIGDSTLVNGADFYVGERELGHIHLDGEVHLLLSAPLAKAVLKADLADAFPWGRDWVQLEITDKKSAERALWLFEIGYDRLNGVSEADLLERIRIS